MAPHSPLPLRAGYHDACHLANAQRVTAEPRQLLDTIPDLTLVDVAEADNLLAGRPDVIATGNAGCLLQIRRHTGAAGIPVVHPVELLDASLRGDTSILQRPAGSASGVTRAASRSTSDADGAGNPAPVGCSRPELGP
ncbi:heterodisulfide reductase-related iron-sulfur binding cluster [Streptomyces sp. YKOK-I1]